MEKSSPHIPTLTCSLHSMFPIFQHSKNRPETLHLQDFRAQIINKVSIILWGCMKGPQPLHMKSAAATCAGSELSAPGGRNSEAEIGILKERLRDY